MKKKLIIILASILAFSGAVHAEDTWKDLYVTRLMKLMTANPTYTDIALTDLDQNGIPEAFLIKKGMQGGINTGITLRDNVLSTIETPLNVTGGCLEDITVYDVDGQSVFVGKEIGRYTAEIQYYELSLSGNTLTCTRVSKNDYADYPALPYRDVYGDDFYTGDFPDRSKLQSFIELYNLPTHINVKPATAKVSVNGNIVDMSGIFVSESNYYKIRDVAMVLSTGVNRFSISWDDQKSAISITTGKKYSPVGGELSGDGDLTGVSVVPCDVKLIVNGEEHTLSAYNIDGNNYFKIRDLSALIGFNVGWDGASGTVTIENN